jgi:ferrous iron transport protein B
MFAAAFFMHHRGVIVLSLYLFGILIAIVIGLILNRFFMRGKPIPFIMELPTYRFPHIKSSALLMWERTKDFLQRAFTIIFVATCAIWFLQSFDVRLNPVQGGSDSMLSAIGNVIAPVFAPLGFGIGICATALIVGFIAKEAVISSLAVLTGASSVAAMQEMLPAYFTPLSAYTFLVFCLIYTPCVAAISVVKRELGSAAALALVARQTLIAWAIAFIVYRIGFLLGLG